MIEINDEKNLEIDVSSNSELESRNEQTVWATK